MKIAQSVVVVALLAIGTISCSSDDRQEPGWAIVKVEILDGPGLASICIDSICKSFAGDAVGSGEFSAFVESGTTFEVLRVGDSVGAGGGSPVGGCMLLRLGTDAADFIAGCDVEANDG